MNKTFIMTILLAFAASVSMYTQTSPIRPMWERKSAPAVILGRYVDKDPNDNEKIPSFWATGNH